MTDSDIPFCPPPDPNPARPKLVAPPGAVDCHAHVFGPESHYAYSPARGYTPPDAPLETYLQMLDTLGIERAVLTQPSVYGTDNTAILDAMARHPGRILGVVAVDSTITDAELADLNAKGARGARVNIADKGGNPFDSMDAVRRFCERLAPLGWHLEVLLHVNEFPNLTQTFADFPVDIVVGHLGYAKSPSTIEDPGFQEFLELVRGGHWWVKLTGTYRITGEDQPPYPDVIPVAQALIAANPDRMIWGSDWPHPSHYRGMPNDAYLLDQLLDWTNAATIQKILVDNPERLFGF
ncbi:MAG: amidohydrolase family protein [Alphaproteobacteria bacterium]|nr:amidohydrolase family protein [Alphaproteobacteria bacterium]